MKHCSANQRPEWELKKYFDIITINLKRRSEKKRITKTSNRCFPKRNCITLDRNETHCPCTQM